MTILSPRQQVFAFRAVVFALMVAAGLTFLPLWAPLVIAAWVAVVARPLLMKVAKTNKQAALVAKALPALAAAIKVAGPKLKEMNELARAQNHHLRAMLTQFKIDLDQAVDDRVLRTQK